MRELQVVRPKGEQGELESGVRRGKSYLITGRSEIFGLSDKRRLSTAIAGEITSALHVACRLARGLAAC